MIFLHGELLVYWIIHAYCLYSGHSKSQGAASHDPCITKENPSKTAKSSPYLTDVASQLSDFNDDHVNQPKSEDHLDDSDQTPDTVTRSHDLNHDESLDLDYDASHDLDHDDIVSASEVETSCEHNSTHLEDTSVVVEDIEVNDNDDTNGVKELQYEFISSNFATKVFKI